MAYNYLVLGPGREGNGMGLAIAYDCLNFGDADRVTLADIDEKNLEIAKAKLNDSRLDTVVADVSYTPGMTQLMRDYDIAASAVPYQYHYDLLRAAVASNTNFCDLGGNNSVVKKQFEFSPVVARNNLISAHDCGIAPGGISIIAVHGINKFKKERGKMPKYVKLYAGGMPQSSDYPLGGYANVFNIPGVVNECKEKAEVLRGGKLCEISSLSTLEKVVFNSLGTFWASETSGGLSRLARVYAGEIDEIICKTLRHDVNGIGHWETMALLKARGLFSEKPFKVLGKEVVPRKVTEQLLEDLLPKDVKDIFVVRVLVGDEDFELCFDIIDKYNEETSHSAMQRMTGYSAAIVAQMILKGEIDKFGAIKQEEIDPYKFILEWSKRGIHLNPPW